MKIAIIGAGYVGLTSAAVFASLGHSVWLLDKDKIKIKTLKSGRVPFYEPELPELLKKSLSKGSLKPTLSFSEAIPDADVIFICVGTPMSKNGEADLSQVFAAAESIAKQLKKYSVIVNKSTVPTGTTERVKNIIRKIAGVSFDVASCPEFLREGNAVYNTLNPDRIVIGTETKCAEKVLLRLHEKLPGGRVTTDIRTAEIIKYASNAFLATKISFINEIANLCEEVGTNVEDVALGMGLDPRIGKDFLKPGIGYGGSCFPKDTRALHLIAHSNSYTFKLLKAVIEVNQTQRRNFLGKVRRAVGDLKGKKIGALGLAFKNNTDDIRESAALNIIDWLIKEGGRVKAFDPKANANAKKNLPALTVCKKPEECFLKTDAVLILTEWPDFKFLPWTALKKKMRHPIVIDGRNLLDPIEMRKFGFKYISVGRP